MISTATSVHGSLPVKYQREHFDVFPRERSCEGFIKDGVNRLEGCLQAKRTSGFDRTVPRALWGGNI